MARFSYDLPNGATISVDAPTREAAIPMLQAEYERVTTQSTGEKVGSGVAQFLQGATAGWLDEGNAALDAVLGRDPSKGLAGGALDYEDKFGDRYRRALEFYRSNEEQFEAENPGLAMGLELGGAIAPAIASGGTAAAPTLGRMAATGALQGGLYGAGASEGDLGDIGADTATGALTGAVLNPAIGRGVQKLTGTVPKTLDAPKAAGKMKESADDIYDKLRADNEVIPDFQQAAAAVVSKAGGRGIGKRGDPELYEQVDFLKSIAGQKAPVTYQQAEDVIAGLQNAAEQSPGVKRTLATKMANELEASLPPSIIAARSQADDMWRRASRSQAVSNAMEEAAQQTSRVGIGGNKVNPMRQRISALLRENRKTGYFSPDEVKMMKHFVEGGSVENLLRWIGSLSPARSTVMSSLFLGGVGTGAALSNPGVIAGVGGMAALGYAGNTAAEKLTKEGIDALQRQILSKPAAQMPTMLPDLTRRLSGAVAGGAAGVSPDTTRQTIWDMM